MSYQLQQENFAAFFNCPFQIYGENSRYISPYKSDLRRFLDHEKNPLFKKFGARTYFTVHQADQVLGRIVAHIHTSSNERHSLSRSYFGFFDCTDDPLVAKLLLGAAEDWGRKQGCHEIAGNFNLTAMQQMGVVTDGFDSTPYIDQLYTPPQIYRLLETNGYERFFPMTTFEVPLTGFDPHCVLSSKSEALLKDLEIHFEKPQRRHFSRLMREACYVLNEGFNQNPMFVPLSDAEFYFQSKEMLWFMDPNTALVARVDNRPVGVIISLPDLNPLLKESRSRMNWRTPYCFLKHRAQNRRACLIFGSVVPNFQVRGLGSVLLFKILGCLVAAGYKSVGITWIADYNKPMLRLVEKLGGRPMHRLHLYRKPL
jgi:GNAT superfamily N-acetyltransferase